MGIGELTRVGDAESFAGQGDCGGGVEGGEGVLV